jgi:hypothetical protein
MIPRIVHYCWLGRGSKPSTVKRCIATWRKCLPNYRIIEWNEKNFNIHTSPYVEEAYRSRKFAFASDVIRASVLYEYGGIYLDTDVKVQNSFDSLLHHHSFWGFEAGNFIATSTIGVEKGHDIIKEYLNYYNNRHFIQSNGLFDTTSNVIVVTQLLQQRGLILNNIKQELGDGNFIYPQSLFSPYDARTGSILKNTETIAIHYYSNSWNLSIWSLIKKYLKKSLAKIVGKSLSESIWLRRNN